MKTKRELVISQLALMDEIRAKANINIVTCGNCGTAFLHKLDDLELTCFDCKHSSEPCDHPDLFYTGMEESKIYEEQNNMTDIEKLKSLLSEISDTDRPKFDRVYNEVLYPRMVNVAQKLKKSELSIGSYLSEDKYNKVVGELFGNSDLQTLVETKMKPYLEEKGFKVAICRPSYYVYIRW